MAQLGGSCRTKAVSVLNEYAQNRFPLLPSCQLVLYLLAVYTCMCTITTSVWTIVLYTTMHTHLAQRAAPGLAAQCHPPGDDAAGPQQLPAP